MSLPTQSRFLSSLTGPSTPVPADWTCAICLRSSADVVVAHGDQHTYCRECLATWLQENNTCPDCREVLFHPLPLPVSAPVPASPRQTTAAERRLDTYQLRQVQGWGYYLELLGSEDRAPGLVSLYLEEMLRRLNHRWEMYHSGRLEMNLRYRRPAAARGVILRRTPRSPARDADLEEETSPLHARRVITAFFAGWWERFVSAPRGAAIYHPLATALLQATVEALGHWDGWHLTATGLRTMVRIRLTGTFEGKYPEEDFTRPGEWDTHVDCVVREVMMLFLAGDREENLTPLQRSALTYEREHEALWRK
ncbi:hypothetical protein M409DRAFT_60520 [Zasmidium cellare ATCC 36951]|uniref:RING-type domain-containing protein n=1 Tax=Zasmidium cellare ATCC 36951 TaxID=1080233 RepID=A0A6A6BY57_ZASCE|nr:uncharacterized protein M409DRAFT_60520 [Zasmidium cellare ATCC 36951]KAF2159744.1 hypothetical protein M409DRAFT_60520 [Zasmidium cellare ATCC 36951]